MAGGPGLRPVPELPVQQPEQLRERTEQLPPRQGEVEVGKEHFIAGNTLNCFAVWKTITHDSFILNAICGITIELEHFPCQGFMPRQLHFSQDENDSINFELHLFMKKGVIQLSSHEAGEFISNIFPRSKKNNRSRIILDLSVLNLEVTYIHFKMESIHTAASLMRKGCFMGSVDLSDTYYTVPIRLADRKLLKFIWENKLYQYTCQK